MKKFPTAAEVLEAFGEQGSIRKTARALGVSFGFVQQRVSEAEIVPPKPAAEPKPWKPGVYLLSCQQNNTLVHPAFWRNLSAYAEWHDGEIMVSRFTYDLSSYGKGSVKPGEEHEKEELWFDQTTAGCFSDEPVWLAPDLLWCGEMNTLPTAVRPLSGLMTYTGAASGVFPHPKVALESSPRVKGPPRMCYTTGALTPPNYIAKKAGQKAHFHHVVGALIVEVEDNGNWSARQINAAKDGSFYDMGQFVSEGMVGSYTAAAAVVLGDLHSEQIDDEAFAFALELIERVQPRAIVLHDVLDFRARNHHERKDHHRGFAKWTANSSSVTQDVQECGSALDRVVSWACEGEVYVVQSNHDEAFGRWLRETDYREDPENALLHLRANLAIYEALEREEPMPDMLPLAFRSIGVEPAVTFVPEGESLVIAGVECAMHGHLGPNGVQGSAQSLSAMGQKAVIGHAHSARIVDGVYQVGTTGKLRMSYNKGPSSWSHTHCVIYPNGKRALITSRETSVL